MQLLWRQMRCFRLQPVDWSTLLKEDCTLLHPAADRWKAGSTLADRSQRQQIVKPEEEDIQILLMLMDAEAACDRNLAAFGARQREDALRHDGL